MNEISNFGASQTLTKKQSLDKTLEHSTRLKLFLIFKKYQNKTHSVRDLLDKVDMKSTSTISWHLEKLEEIGLIEKNHANQYQISKKGMEFKDLEVPYRIPILVLRGEFVPKRFLLIGFLVTSILISVGFYYISHQLAFLFAFTILVVATVIIILEFLHFNQELKKYL